MPARLNGSLLLRALALLALTAPALAQASDGGSMIIDAPMARPQPQPLAEPSAPESPEPKAEARAPVVEEGAAPASSARATPRQAAPIAEEGDRPDETALRYYAGRGEMGRVNVEIERLVRLYKSWTPPLDLFAQEQSGAPDEEALWALFSADRIDELRATIEARKKEQPGWAPSKDLETKLRRKETRLRIMTFFRQGRWQDLADYVKQDSHQPDDTDVEMLWAVAEAFSKTKQTADAIGVYRSILNSSSEKPARLATIHKAMASLRMSDVEPLIAMGRTEASGKSEFAAIETDIVRARISAYLHDERADKIPDGELAVFQDHARGASDPNQAGLVAWYYYKTKAFRDALEWFKLALERGGDAMVAHGLAHSLRELDMRRETEEVAYAWREPLVNNLILFIDILERDLTLEHPPYIEPERLARYAKATMEAASGEGAQALAWYAYNSCQYEVAHQWFQRAVAWFPKEATVYGHALTLKRLKKDKEFWELMNRYDGLFAKALEIVFPDGYYHPPTACDLLAKQNLRAGQQNLGAYTAPASYAHPQQNGMSGYGVTAAQAAGYAPQAYPPAAHIQRQEFPKFDRKLFPAPTDPENAMRFAASASPATHSPSLKSQAAVDMPLQREPVRGPWPLVASRVPGVGRMPYERYGFSLLPGWNGATGPTSPTYAVQRAPKGTLWEAEQAEKARPRIAFANGMSGVPAAGAPMQGMAQPPAAAQTPPHAAQPVVAPYPQQPPVGAAYAPPQYAPPYGAPAYVAPPHVAPPHAAPPAVAQPVAPAPVAASASPPAPAPVAPTSEPAREASEPVARLALPQTTDAGALAQRAIQFFSAKNYAGALEALDQRAPLAPETTNLKMIRAWSLLHLQRKEEARGVFATLGAQGSQKSRSGSP